MPLDVPSFAESSRRHLLGWSLAELGDALGGLSRARAVLRWAYTVPTWPTAPPLDIPNVSYRVWRPFARSLDWQLPSVALERTATDLTVKAAMDIRGGRIETVLIPAAGRSTVCVSSQVGCTRRCQFCATKDLGFTRNLEAWEIVAQYVLARRWAPPNAPARNVVFMGMGEPLDNFDAVVRAVELLTQAPAPQLKARSVTVSTSGVLPQMRRFLASSSASLALSVNATTEELREQLMPHSRTWPLRELMLTLVNDAATHPNREHFIEYVLLAGVNDSLADAHRLIDLMRGVRGRINLIPHNQYEGSRFSPTPEGQVLDFQRVLMRAGLPCFIRWPKGRSISAACGQLALAAGATG